MTRTETDEPNPIDVFAGRQLTARRLELGYTQSDLARALGVAFQQVQKYEKGANRISASKLWAAAAFLQTDVNYFFPADEMRGNIAPPVDNPVAQQARRLSPPQQRLLLDVMKAMLAVTAPADPEPAHL